MFNSKILSVMLAACLIYYEGCTLLGVSGENNELALMLLIDKSQSMSHRREIRDARDAAMAAIFAMEDGEYIGITAYDQTLLILMDLVPAAKARELARAQVGNIETAGKSNLLPALAFAVKRLSNSKAGKRHILALCNGNLPGLSASYFSVVNRAQKNNISISVVALGVGAEQPMLKRIAQKGGGSFYHVLEPSQLSSVFVEEIKIVRKFRP